MNYKKHLIIALLSIFSLTTSYGQKVDNDTLVDAMKRDVTSFFISKKILKKSVVKESLNYVLINEVNKNRTAGFDKIGIYNIAVFQSHSEKHILIKENSKYKIYDIQNIDLVLKQIIDFSSRNKLSTNEMLSYLKKIIQVYDDNYNYEYTSIENKK